MVPRQPQQQRQQPRKHLLSVVLPLRPQHLLSRLVGYSWTLPPPITASLMYTLRTTMEFDEELLNFLLAYKGLASFPPST